MDSTVWKEVSAYRVTTKHQSWTTFSPIKPMAGVEVDLITVLVPKEAEIARGAGGLIPESFLYMESKEHDYLLPYTYSQALAKGLVRLPEAVL